MSTFTSSFKTLPKSAALRELVGTLPALKDLPFMSLPEASYERQYLHSLYRLVTEGKAKSSRPGQHTLMLDDVQFAIDISGRALPLLTTKAMYPVTFLKENLWFLSGDTDVRFLKANGVAIWDEWVIPQTARFAPAERYDSREFLNYLRINCPEDYKAWRVYQNCHQIGRASLVDIEKFLLAHNGKSLAQYPCVGLVSGSIGHGAYGAQWRNWADLRAVDKRESDRLTSRGSHTRVGTAGLYNHPDSQVLVGANIDQVAQAVQMLRTTPDSRRIMVSAWNPAQIADAALPPCHFNYQFTSHVNEDSHERELTIKLLMRSSDAPVGACCNIMQYAALAHMFAHVTGHKATKLVFSPGDYHIYEDQLAFVAKQLVREPRAGVRPTLEFGDHPQAIKEIDDFNLTCLEVHGYNRALMHPAINYPVAV